jgi:AcrR family transcriptional regulator
MATTRRPKATYRASTAASKKHGSTRNEILDAGLKLFSDRGFDGISVKDIETAVGLTPGRGSFYRHFESKEVLLEHIVHREVDKVRNMRDMQQRAIGGSLGDRRAELVLQYRLSLIGLEQIKSLINLLAREYGRFPELMQQLYELLVEESLVLHAGDLVRDIQKNKVRSTDAEALATVVQSALVGYHLSKTYFGHTPQGIDNERFINALVDLMLEK